MEKIISVLFDVEAEAYQAFTELKHQLAGEGYKVAQAALVSRDEFQLSVEDRIDTGVDTRDDTAKGMAIGATLGILGGPLGVLLGASTGSLVGGAKDAADAVSDYSMLEFVSSFLLEGRIAIIAHVFEETEGAFDAAIGDYGCLILRRDAERVAEDVETVRKIEVKLRRVAKEEAKALKRIARAEMRDRRHEERAERRAEKKAARAARREELFGK